LYPIKGAGFGDHKRSLSEDNEIPYRSATFSVPNINDKHNFIIDKVSG